MLVRRDAGKVGRQRVERGCHAHRLQDAREVYSRVGRELRKGQVHDVVGELLADSGELGSRETVHERVHVVGNDDRHRRR